MDTNILLAVASVLLFIAFIAYFGYVIYHQQQVEPDEKPVYGVELLEQHYAPGETVEQPTPYWVAPIPAAPDPLEISANLDRKIVAGGAMLFALFGLVGGYLLLQVIPSGPLALRAAAAEKQLEQQIHRGKNLYANFCFNCHGRTGQGNGEQGEDDWADIVTIREHLEGSPSTTPDPGPPPAPLSGKDIAQQYCVTCHSFDPNKASTVPLAPNLGHYSTQGPLNDENKRAKASGDADWLYKWVANAPKVKPGVIMPVWLDKEGGQLDEATVRLVVKYLQEELK